MVEGVDSIGEAVTGGMAARAVEPRAGEPSGHASACLNCDTVLIGEHCHACGQSGHIHRTLSAIGHDIAHSVLHFDGKIWRTLPLLAWRPGELTRRYVQGERARFVSPMALFLFSVFLMFAVFSAIGAFDISSMMSPEDQAEQAREARERQAESAENLRQLEAGLQKARAAGAPTAELEAQIADQRRDMVIERRAREAATRIVTGEEGRATPDADEAENEPELNILSQTGWKPLDDAITKAEKNPSLLLYKLQSNAYKFSWALIPISVPFLWLMFLHRRRYRAYKVYDHTVFITYSIAFVSIGAILLTVAGKLGVGNAITGSVLAFVPPIHMYRQLRGAYCLSRWSAAWRAFLLLNFAFIAAGLFFSLPLAMGVLG